MATEALLASESTASFRCNRNQEQSRSRSGSTRAGALPAGYDTDVRRTRPEQSTRNHAATGLTRAAPSVGSRSHDSSPYCDHPMSGRSEAVICFRRSWWSASAGWTRRCRPPRLTGRRKEELGTFGRLDNSIPSVSRHLKSQFPM